MNKTNATVASTKGTSTLVRAKFGPGMLLQYEDLEQLNSYTRDLSRLLFKSFFGCGVICGLVVQVDPKCGKVCITVGAGVALSCSGDPISVPKDQTFTLDENCDSNIDGPLWVLLCGTVKQCAPRNSMCASDDDESPSEPTRERDGFEIRVVSTRPKCLCGCKDPNDRDPKIKLLIDTDCKCVNPNLECYTDHYGGNCGCNCGDGSNCTCECILLARLEKTGRKENPEWTSDHSVRRFIRPVLMRDPQVKPAEERKPPEQPQNSSDAAVIKEEYAIALNRATVATDVADKAAAQAMSAAMNRAEKSVVARMAADKYTEAKAAADGAKTAADKKRTAMVLDEASAAVVLAQAEADNATADAAKYETAHRQAVEEKLVRENAVVAATDKLAALVEKLAPSTKNVTMPPAGKEIEDSRG